MPVTEHAICAARVCCGEHYICSYTYQELDATGEGGMDEP